VIVRDPVSLICEIELRRGLSHDWQKGRCCVSFALACAHAQTGVDHLADLPDWKNRAQALKVARSLGGLIAALDARFDRVPAALATRGDIAGLPDAAFGVRLMVVEGATLVGPGETGVERLWRNEMTMAWSVTGKPAGVIGDE
jgi:hypothetical protein